MPGALRIEVSGGQAGTPYLYRGNAEFTVDGFWYEELAERGADEYRPEYASIVNEKGGRMFMRDFLGVPCVYWYVKKDDYFPWQLKPEEHP